MSETGTLLPDEGRADWTNFESYWSEASADWLVDRAILRYNLVGDLPAGSTPGQFAWVESVEKCAEPFP